MVTGINPYDLDGAVEKLLTPIEDRLKRYLHGLIFIPIQVTKVHKSFPSQQVDCDRGLDIFRMDFDRALEGLEKNIFDTAKEAGTTNLDLTLTWHRNHLLIYGHLLLELRTK